MSETLRVLLEAQQVAVDDLMQAYAVGDEKLLFQIGGNLQDNAVAALALLDAAERLGHLSQRIYPEDDRVALPDPVVLASRDPQDDETLTSPDNQPEFCDRCDDVHRPGRHIL